MYKVTPQAYATLTFTDQLCLIDSDGVYLGVYRFDHPHFVTLYSLFDFYVEVWYDPMKDAVIKLIPFEEYDRLDPFLQRIDITKTLQGVVK